MRRWSLLAAARITLAQTRSSLREDARSPVPGIDELASEVRALAQRFERPFPLPVLNATGIVLHTNLGRAPIAPGAAAEAARAASGYSDLELDLPTGERGSRVARISELLLLASGAEAALVVNNTAAAVMLAVDTLAADREVVLSRGELVEIGGSFRIPEILAATRARIREIGTTNRTHLHDYEGAIGPETGMLLKVHRSNFSVEGFTAEVGIPALAELGRAHGVPVVEDLGSGSFVDLSPYGIPETEAWRGLRDGADVVMFSGDKLLGGPQAGIILGRRDLVDAMKRSPLARALRVDKLTLAALSWTLRALLDGRSQEIPVIQMLTASEDTLAARAERLARVLRESGIRGISVERGRSPVGGGALPDLELPGAVVRVPSDVPNRLARALRLGEPPVLARVRDGALVLDVRTLSDADFEAVGKALGTL